MTTTANNPRDETSLPARLRSLRMSAALSQRTAAELSGLTQPKVARLENGLYTPDPDDVAALCRAYDASQAELDELLDMARAAQDEKHSVGRVHGSWGFQHRLNQIDMAASTVREFSATVLLGSAQTDDYGLLDVGDIDEVDRIRFIERRRERQLLPSATRKYTLIHTESALSLMFGSAGLMANQMARLIELCDHEHVRMGVVPAERPLPRLTPWHHSYALFDESAVVVGTIHEALILRNEADLIRYQAMWDAVAASAVWSDEARAVFERARQRYESML